MTLQPEPDDIPERVIGEGLERPARLVGLECRELGR
jgi:hypothetical protein